MSHSCRMARPHPQAPANPPSPPLPGRLLGTFQYTPRAMRLVWRSAPAGTVALAALTLVSALLPLQVAYVGKLIVDAVMAAHTAAAGPARDAARALALRWVLVELGVVVA